MTDQMSKPKVPGQRLLHISTYALLCIFKKDSFVRVVENALPDDAVAVMCRYSEANDAIHILVQSEEWEAVALGESVPMMTPVFGSVVPEEESPNEQ